MVDIRCKQCHSWKYTVGSATWYTRGTQTRYPNLYCDSCCGGSHSSYSYSGHVVKMECAGCSNVIVPITWNDWNNKRTQYDGRCSSCRSSELARIRREKEERERRERERRERERKARLKSAKTKPHYCPENYSLSKPNWADVDHKIDSWNYLWEKCIIYCKEKARHCVYNKPDFSDAASPNLFNLLSAGHYHREITDKLSLAECPKCKTIKDQQAEVARNAKSAQTKLNTLNTNMKSIEDILLNEFGTNEPKTESKSDDQNAEDIRAEIAQIEAKEAEITKLIEDFQGVQQEIHESRTKNADFIAEIEADPTCISEDKLNETVEKLQNMMQKSAENKEKLHQQVEAANQRELENLAKKAKIDEEYKKEVQKEARLNDINKRIADHQATFISFTGGERSAKKEDIQKANEKIDNLMKMMQGKFSENKQRKQQLKECQDRMKKINAKLKKEKSDCKYLIQLMDEEYKRLSSATDAAMDKFEQRTNYFLSVTVGLKQDVVEKLIDYELEDIVELTEQDLIDEVGINKGPITRKLLREIKKLKAKMDT